MKSQRPILAPPFQRPLHDKVDSIHEIVRKGIIMDSPDVIGELLPDGRMRLRLRNPVSAAPAAAVTPPPGPGSVGSFTEFYCQSGGSNLNAGSTTNNTAAFTSTNGNWDNTLKIFTPTDGSTPAASVNVGDFASVYIDGATVGVFIARVLSVAAGINGAITVSSTVAAGSGPATSATARTIKIGGAWKGPNAAIGFPLTIINLGKLQDAAGDPTRLNLKNDADYSITAQITQAGPTFAMVISGYSSTPGDGGQATIAGGATAAQLLVTGGQAVWENIIFSSTATTGTSALVSSSVFSSWIRCIFHGARGSGIIINSACVLLECEAYDCNKSNSAGFSGFQVSAQCVLTRCYSHDHTSGTNAIGFQVSAPTTMIHCIAHNCAGRAINTGAFNSPLVLRNCDFYKNGGDAVFIASGASTIIIIENCNFLKNTGKAINNQSVLNFGFAFNSGYGTGTMANGSADAFAGIISQDAITYAANTTPWNAPDSGDFTIVSGDAIKHGRGVFIETGNSRSGTLGTPNIGAA